MFSFQIAVLLTTARSLFFTSMFMNLSTDFMKTILTKRIIKTARILLFGYLKPPLITNYPFHTMVKSMNSIFIEECKAIAVERSFSSNWAIIEGMWELGKRISEEEEFT